MKIIGMAGADLVEFGKRMRQMVAQSFLGSRRVGSRDGIHDGAVVFQHALHLAGGRQVQTAQAVDVAAVAAHQQPEVVDTGGQIHHAMKLMVFCHKAHEIARLTQNALAGKAGAQVDQQRGRGGARQIADHLQFDGTTQKMRLTRLGHIDLAHTGSRLGVKASRTGVWLTPNRAAISGRIKAVPGGSDSDEMLSRRAS
jgi:hypothetical protein